ncbi:MAG TPA: ABC transporter permease [Actinomycetota bacterium]|nr:ABC transporter permease [Actinomycetota bacterium]
MSRSDTDTDVSEVEGREVDERVDLESAPSAEMPASIIGRSPWEIFWRHFREDRFAIAGLVIIFFMILLALFAPVLASITNHAPNQVNLNSLDEFGLPSAPQWWWGPESKAPPGYYLGVDDTGRDLFVRIAYGARTSLTVAFLATGIALVIGVLLGLAAGFFRGKVDTVISRATDVVLALPILLLALGIASACGANAEGCLGGFIKPGLRPVILIIGLFSWPYISRIVRGQVLSIREKEFVEASRSLGASNRRILLREILPNVAAPIIVYTTLIIPSNILFEAGLSFLGVGVPDTTPSWGAMLADAGTAFRFAPWLMIFPGLALFLTTLAFNLVGDGLRDALDPRKAV